MFFCSKTKNWNLISHSRKKITNKFKIDKNTQTVLGFVVQGDSEPRGEKVWRFMLIQSYPSFLAFGKPFEVGGFCDFFFQISSQQSISQVVQDGDSDL